MIQEIKNWTLHYENVEPLTGTVPCSMYSLLLESGKMEDPFYRMNEYAARDLSEKDCEMTAAFSASPEERAAVLRRGHPGGHFPQRQASGPCREYAQDLGI